MCWGFSFYAGGSFYAGDLVSSSSSFFLLQEARGLSFFMWLCLFPFPSLSSSSSSSFFLVYVLFFSFVCYYSFLLPPSFLSVYFVLQFIY